MTPKRFNKSLDFFTLVLVLLGIFLFSTIKQNASADIAPGEAKISFLDVGQGDSILISLSQNKQVLIDTGRASSTSYALQKKMPPFDREIEIVFLTHPDSDHVGGFGSIADSFKIDKVYLNTEQSDSKTFEGVLEKIKEKNISQEVIRKGDLVNLNDLKIDVLWPKQDSTLSENNNSLVLLAQIKQSRTLFTGDLEIEGQQQLLSSYSPEQLAADLYKVPHHGSGGAWNEKFIEAVKAKNAVISVGKNSYGHPAQTVIDGLNNLKIMIFRTDQLGTIDFISTSSGFVKK